MCRCASYICRYTNHEDWFADFIYPDEERKPRLIGSRDLTDVVVKLDFINVVGSLNVLHQIIHCGPDGVNWSSLGADIASEVAIVAVTLDDEAVQNVKLLEVRLCHSRFEAEYTSSVLAARSNGEILGDSPGATMHDVKIIIAGWTPLLTAWSEGGCEGLIVSLLEFVSVSAIERWMRGRSRFPEADTWRRWGAR